ITARAADVRDVGRRLRRILLGVQDTSFAALVGPSIIVAEELTPSDTASLDPDNAKGLCLAGGGQTSHVAILARTLAIPAVIGLGQTSIQMLKEAQTLVLDGASGQVISNPTSETLTRYTRAQEHRKARLSQHTAIARQTGHTAN